MWVEMMRASIDMAINRFTAERMLNEYYLLYQPLFTLKQLKHQVYQAQATQDSDTLEMFSQI